MEEHTEIPSSTPVGTKMSTKTWIIIGIVAVLLLLAGKIFSPERIAEHAIERAFEAEGVDLDIDVANDGTVEYSATGENGESVQMNAGENVTLPEGWPSNIPVPSDATLTYAGSVAGDSEGTNYMVSYTSAKSLSDISALYTEVFTANGWSQVSNVAMPDSVMLGTEYGENNSVGVYATKDAKGVAVTLTVSIGK